MTDDLEVLLVRVGMARVDHDAVERDAALGKGQGQVNVLLGRRVVEVDRNGDRGRVRDGQAEGKEVDPAEFCSLKIAGESLNIRSG